MRTKNQEFIASIEKFVDNFIDERGVSPTITEIAEGIGTSKSTVGRYVSYMRDNGLLDYTGRRSIVTKASQAMRQGMTKVPIVGAIPCGVPNLAEENIEGYVCLPELLFGTGTFYLLRAHGESMIGAGIDDGDLILIRQQATANLGQIVVALIGTDDATLKRFYPDPENGIFRLHPENPTMEDIIVTDCVVQGVAVRVIKNLE